MRRVEIFDTTLRDGEQSPGISLSVEEKVEIARQLARLRVDVIEAGFPITSEGDFESVSRIAAEVAGPRIAGLARIHEEDIVRAWEAVQWSGRPRIHTFVGTSDLHIEHQMRSNRNDILQRAIAAALSERSHDVRIAQLGRDRLTGWSGHVEPLATHDSGTRGADSAAAVFIDPSVLGADYTVANILSEAFPKEANEI